MLLKLVKPESMALKKKIIRILIREIMVSLDDDPQVLEAV
jgi:hypothetical protein